MLLKNLARYAGGAAIGIRRFEDDGFCARQTFGVLVWRICTLQRSVVSIRVLMRFVTFCVSWV
ncbi:hypothetical protein [Aporhodopirellula rubra]|uniref:hypothetical protein n=1 Tax=Aporhodopirellula rubra TaxID=980271 RepID=UPI001C85C36D|nr:hypothetical protein [Aporhodopirellula rubra]